MEYVLGSLWFWIGVIAVVAILAGAVNHFVTTSNKTKRYVADAANGGDHKKLAEESAAVQRQLLARLDALDGRLATVEKTLTDIPG
jgi:anti-sigma-K factor RskA